jgi:hypothetical protein
MRIFVPSPYQLSAREKIERDMRLLGRCVAMLAGGAGVIVVGVSFGTALSIWSIKLVEMAGLF